VMKLAQPLPSIFPRPSSRLKRPVHNFPKLALAMARAGG
jgi:hypothetical protein